MRFYVINPEYWETMFVEDMAMELVEDHDIYMSRLFSDKKYLNIELDEEQEKEYARRCFEEYFEVLENGDTNIGDWFDEMFEDADKTGLREARDRVENDLDRLYDDLEEAHYFTVMDQVNTVTMVMLITGALNSIIMIAITTLLHRNKWHVVKSAGISFSVAGSLSLIMWAVLRRIVSSAIIDNVDSNIEQSIYDSIMHSMMMFVMICLVLTCIGAGAAILGGVNASAKNRDIEDGYDGGYE